MSKETLELIEDIKRSVDVLIVRIASLEEAVKKDSTFTAFTPGNFKKGQLNFAMAGSGGRSMINSSMINITRLDYVSGSHKTGSLSSKLTAGAISKILGFKPDKGDGDGKVTKEWSFKYKGKEGNIWDYKGSKWSTFGPREIFVELFGDNVE